MSNTIPTPPCDEFDPDNLNVEQARARMLASVAAVVGIERLALRDALDRVLAADVISPINVPPYANSAMDGYAVVGSDLPSDDEKALTLIGAAFAGAPFEGEVKTGKCIRIMTGAPLPTGADTVIMQEHVRAEDTTITLGPGHSQGQNVRHIGEDLRAGKPVLSAGKKIGPAELGLLASLGTPEVSVYRKLRVVFFSTGDELRSVGEPLGEGQIYDSNRYTLYGMLKRLHVEVIDMGVIPDQRAAVEQAFIEAAAIGDAIITSGGVSVGEADFVKDTLAKLGSVDFWKINMKPGKPLAFGKIGQAVFFGLPGNPVSVMATFYQFALPTLKAMMGQSQTVPVSMKVPCKSLLKKRPGRTDFQRGILAYDDQGQLLVDGAGMQASHVLSGMSRANCFIVLPLEAGNVEAGSLVEVQPFEGLV
ncbi:MAG: molybdopterin molybdotransferase MoeA [Gammaproteobacteria bacterium]